MAYSNNNPNMPKAGFYNIGNALISTNGVLRITVDEAATVESVPAMA